MKKIGFVLVLFILLIGLLGCQGQAKELEIDKITIYQLKNGSDKIVLEDKETIEIIVEAVSGAVKVPGIANMADPEYRIELGEQAYFLWISEESGTIMDLEDTHTIYSLSDNSTKQINNLILEANKQ